MSRISHIFLLCGYYFSILRLQGVSPPLEQWNVLSWPSIVLGLQRHTIRRYITPKKKHNYRLLFCRRTRRRKTVGVNCRGVCTHGVLCANRWISTFPLLFLTLEPEGQFYWVFSCWMKIALLRLLFLAGGVFTCGEIKFLVNALLHLRLRHRFWGLRK